MITENVSEMNGFCTEGFVVETPSPLEVVVNSGKLHFTMKDTVVEYEAFAFDVEADPDFPVVYDIYLLQNKEVHVDRTVVTPTNLPFYKGDGVLLHTLTSFHVPSGTTSLDEVEICVRKVNCIEESQSEGQQSDEGAEGASQTDSKQ